MYCYSENYISKRSVLFVELNFKSQNEKQKQIKIGFNRGKIFIIN